MLLHIHIKRMYSYIHYPWLWITEVSEDVKSLPSENLLRRFWMVHIKTFCFLDIYQYLFASSRRFSSDSTIVNTRPYWWEDNPPWVFLKRPLKCKANSAFFFQNLWGILWTACDKKKITRPGQVMEIWSGGVQPPANFSMKLFFVATKSHWLGGRHYAWFTFGVNFVGHVFRRYLLNGRID